MGSQVKLIVIPVVVVLVAAAALYLFLALKKSPVVSTFTAPRPVAQSETLGSKIYQEASNPIKGKVPTVSPVVNPVQGVYKNPFE